MAMIIPSGILPSGNPADYSLSNINDLIHNLGNWALFIGGGLATIYLIIGAINYFTAYGNEEKASTGKKTITWAIIGIVVIVGAEIIVSEIWKFTTSEPFKTSTSPSYKDGVTLTKPPTTDQLVLSPLDFINLQNGDININQNKLQEFLNGNLHNLSADELAKLKKQLISQLPPQLQGAAEKEINKYQDQIQSSIDKEIQKQTEKIFNQPSTSTDQAVDEANMSAGEQEIEDYFNGEDEEGYIYDWNGGSSDTTA